METGQGIQFVFGTKEDVFILTSSGTGGMEAAVVNTLSPGDRVLVVNGGKFGERWRNICNAYGVKGKEIVLDWGRDCPKERLAAEMKAVPELKAVFATLSETSSGAVYDIQGFGEVVSKTDAVLVVDGISGIAATPCPMDDWHIDVMVAGSQKSFMIPPGLAFIGFSPKAWKSVEASKLPKFYFDAVRAKKNLEKQTTPWTPAISLVVQQHKSLEIIKRMGLEALYAHHRVLAEATRAGVRALGLEILAERPGNILTAVKTPAGLDGTRLVKVMQDKYRIYIAGAQEPNKGKFFRIAHLGYMGAFDVITALSALELTLADMGYPFNMGAAVKAAELILRENWS